MAADLGGRFPGTVDLRSSVGMPGPRQVLVGQARQKENTLWKGGYS